MDKLNAMGLTQDEDSNKSSKRSRIDEMFHAKSNAYDWKKKLGKYLRLRASEARAFGLIGTAEKMTDDSSGESDKGSSDGSGDGAEDNEWADDHDTMDDITGYHFVDIPGLFVAYAYVTAAAKVLESREVTRQLHKIPEFEEVYHLVIDSVDTYNEAWQNAYLESTKTRAESKAAISHSNDVMSPRGGPNVFEKKHVYMSTVSHYLEIVLHMIFSLSNICFSGPNQRRTARETKGRASH